MVPLWLFAAVVVVLVVVLGVVVHQRDVARAALTVELWQRHLRNRAAELGRAPADAGADWWQQVAGTLPRHVLQALEDSAAAAAEGHHVVRYRADGSVTVDGVPDPAREAGDGGS